MREIDILVFFVQQGRTNERLKATHISVYMALFCCWNIVNYQVPFRISRKRIMEMSKIQSIATYHKCMREISEFGYIEYKPSFDKFQGTQVTFINH
jgi:hypothetical protein